MSSIKDVGELNKKFGFPVLDKPGFLAPSHMQMRLDFLLEEVNELAEATGFELGLNTKGKIGYIHSSTNCELDKALDALIDITYVALGTADMMGFGSHVPLECMSKWSSIWWESWNRVHTANMAKERGKTSRGHDIDLIKPAGWKKPEFGDLLC